MDYNNEFKVIDTEEKAYFLGLFYADGSISLQKRKNSNYVKPQVQISLTDEQLIYDLHKYFPFFNLEVFDFGKYKPTWSKQFALRKANKLLVDDLLDKGVLERKSGENSYKLSIPKIDDSLIHHFVRGFFDGDGSINIASARPHLRRAEICGSSEQFLLQIKSILEQSGVDCPIFRKKTKGYKNPLYILEWVNTMDVFDLRDYLYKNATIYLSRKKELFDSLVFVDKKEDNPECIHCHTKSCQKQGIRVMKHGSMYRYHCTNCDKRFSIPAPCKKQGELLETPAVKQDNQQPSLSSNTLEGSTTNNRVLPSKIEDSNVDTSALPIVIERDKDGNPLMSITFKIFDFGDDIV
jgi:hypothetical protein